MDQLSSIQDRARGALAGLAVGDALGAPVEFESPSRIAGRRAELREMPGGGGFGWAPGEFTDDTQMALVLARHLDKHHGTIDQDSLASEFAAWAREAADVGTQTRQVLNRVQRDGDWRSAIAALRTDAAGNGSLMRVAPVSLPAPSADAAATLARLQSEVTHPNETCQDACAVFSRTLWIAIDSGTLPPLNQVANWATTPSVRDAVRAALDTAPPTMSGWVISTLTGALWAVNGGDQFEEAVWRAVELGEDADTVGAVAGALAGAIWGFSGIPAAFADRLQSKHPLFVDTYPKAFTTLADQLLGLRPQRLTSAIGS